MNSQRIVIFIALWLILSCFLLEHAEGFLLLDQEKDSTTENEAGEST